MHGRENEPRDARDGQPDPKSVAPWAEDWSDPRKMRRMSATIPLLWMLIPFLACVLWGYFFA